MAGTGTRSGVWAAAAWLLLAAAPAGAQQEAPALTPTYKCTSKGRVVYTQIPCAGGRELGPAGAKTPERYKTPPQDRAKAARRAQLTPEARKECTALEGKMKQQEAELKAKGPTPTIEEETPLVKTRLRFRELKC
jgi:hypothetical protein